MYKRFVSFVLIFCFVITIIPINNYEVEAKTKSAPLLWDKSQEASITCKAGLAGKLITFNINLPSYTNEPSLRRVHVGDYDMCVLAENDKYYIGMFLNPKSGRIVLRGCVTSWNVFGNQTCIWDDSDIKIIKIGNTEYNVDSIGVQMILTHMLLCEYVKSGDTRPKSAIWSTEKNKIACKVLSKSEFLPVLIDKAYAIADYEKDVKEFFERGNSKHYDRAVAFSNQILGSNAMREFVWHTDSGEDPITIFKKKYITKDKPNIEGSEITNPWEYMAWYVWDKEKQETAETEEEIDSNVTENLATLDATKMTYKEWVETICWFARGEEKDKAGNVFDYDNYKDGVINSTVLKREEKAVIYGILQGLCKYNSTYNGKLIPTFSKDENDRKLLNKFNLTTMVSFLSETSASPAYKSELDSNLLSKEAVESSLAEIKSVGTAISDNHMARMLTFNSRLTYLASNTSEDSEVDEKVIDYYTNSTNQSMCPDPETLTLDTKYLPTATRGKDNGAICFALYIATMNEMYYFYKDSTVVIYEELKANRDQETVSSDLKHWATALDEVRKGIEFSQQSTLSDLWIKKNSNAGDKSLEDLYEELKEMVGDLQSLNELSDANIKPETGDALTEFFASIPDGKLNDYVLKGISYSASYIPMKTNLYDPITLNDYNTEFLQNFFYKYGFMRKALYIDSAKDSAEELRNTGLKGETRVCTLKDLVDPAGDITLYIDRNFYNANELADLLGESYDKITNDKEAEESTEQNIVEKWWTKLTDNIEEVFETSFQNQVRTGGVKRYSDRLRNRIANQSDSGYIPSAGIKDSTNSATSEEDNRADDNKDSIVLTSV